MAMDLFNEANWSIESSKFREYVEVGGMVFFYIEIEGGAFPNLRELEIYECPKLTRGLPVHLPSLTKFKILNCSQLVAPLARSSSQCKLMLQNCNTVVLLNESLTGIHELKT
jgi:hypothetical protein